MNKKEQTSTAGETPCKGEMELGSSAISSAGVINGKVLLWTILIIALALGASGASCLVSRVERAEISEKQLQSEQALPNSPAAP